MNELQDDLTAIGFTEYEARVYLALLRRHPANGYQISKESGVPRSMVYEALGRLRGRGAVLESAEERATLYRPLAPGLLLERHQGDHERLVGRLRAGLDELYRPAADDRVWSIHGRPAALAYAAEMIRAARRPLYLVLSDDDLAILRPEVLAACERGVESYALLTGELELGCGRSARHPPLESELQELEGALLVAVEGGELLIAGPAGPPAGARAAAGSRATVTAVRDLVFIARQFVWMELFTQRIYGRLGADLLARLEPEDRRIFESLGREAGRD
jgi:Cd2+/Zn2+-exporting ATPase